MRRVAILVLLVLAGCFEHVGWTTPPQAWEPAYDAPYAAVTACWRYEPASKPPVYERNDCFVDTDGYQRFWFWDEKKKEWQHVAGDIRVPFVKIEICPDHAALEHELSHYVRYDMTGSLGSNGDGDCGL